ncbi:MAG: DUF2586 domain-containing protein [Prevotellaceae bacterium]|jgi:hypothetical protein|nr:DUF2586 domain-containing protein [Prevotellaceae bacterium]
MALNDITFQKQNGGLGRTAPNADPVSGLLMALNENFASSLEQFDETGGEEKIFVARMKYFEQLADQFGIDETEPEEDGAAITDPVKVQKNAIVYHVREFFRMSPAGTLYLAVKTGETGKIKDEDIKALQYYAGGEIRQAGVFAATITDTDVADYQVACSQLFNEHQPLSVIATHARGAHLEVDEFYRETANRVLKDRSNVSILISRDLDPELDNMLGDWAHYGCIGTVLGALSSAMVHESIAWVQKFPLGLKVPGFITGEPVKKVTVATLDQINELRYLFVRTHIGNAGNYLNDSHTLDVGTSDYANIENVRTMDKAIRGIRANLLPYLNAPLYVDAQTGNLRSDMVAYLETIAGSALEDMERAGELSGYRVVIDPEQNVLATSELEIQIKNVPVGVMRKVKVKIGYTTKL